MNFLPFIAFVFGVVVGFATGALVWRKHGTQVTAAAPTVVQDAKTIVEDVKKL